MKLPNAIQAAVTCEKIADYLFNPADPDNGGKADFFKQLGFHRERWEVLAAALTKLAVESEVTIASESPHGNKYVIVGRMQTPGGKSPLVQTIWMVDKNRDPARLVTAYPRQV